MERLIHVLLFSVLCLFIQSISCEYVLIREKMTWNEAQVYCRQHHIDLVTVQNTEDWTNVQREVQPALTSDIWIGLFNNISSWQWSYQNEYISFSRWSGTEPNNAYGKEECGALWSDGGWDDRDCSAEFPVFCYKENETEADRFVFVNIPMSWHEALSYCRQHYTDLAVIHNKTEDQVLLHQMSMLGISYSWIGLFRDSWKWSDDINVVDVSSINWMTGQPDLTGVNQPCETKKQIVRFELKSGQNVNDPAVMKTILQSVCRL
ncbi:putative C-type lectin domain family 20 member A [Triplophysa dalaica]|uniref:putative C-type lectin domain family 20 member A n=1 Tax=Triplophysa dalaica TaxID=1582913 RepID=UPI0024DFD411|nr:putative C-type lectin domain family 20 member A [Triplophysa dalaica]